MTQEDLDNLTNTEIDKLYRLNYDDVYQAGFKKALELVFTETTVDISDEDIIENLFTKYHDLLD